MAEIRTTGRQFTWRLPPSPTHKVYRNLEAELDLLYKTNPKLAMARDAYVCTRDMWWLTKRCLPFGGYRITDPGHPMKGRLWIEHPWIYARIREVQANIDARQSFILYQWARHMFKTTIITVTGSIYILAKDPQETIQILTHKVDQVGEGLVGADLRQVMEKGERLRALFPQFRNLKEASDTRIVVGRKHGPRDASVSVHSIKAGTHGTHPTWILLDDPVGPDTVESKRVADRVDQKLDELIPLRGGNTPIVFIGTPWGRRDPVVQRAAAGYFVGGISRHPSGFREGKPVLRTMTFLKEQFRAIRNRAIAEAQFDLVVRDPHRKYFRLEDLHFYTETPEFWAEAANIHIIVDYAKGGEESDYTVVRVVAVRHDRKRYILDLFREKIGNSDTLDLLFGIPKWENPESPRNSWKPNGGKGIVEYWSRFTKAPIQVWFETGGADAWPASAKRELARIAAEEGRKLNCRVRSLGADELPKGVSTRSKVARIKILDTEYRSGVILYPRPPAEAAEMLLELEREEGGGWSLPVGRGFGHGSRFGHGHEEDPRDTLIQFISDELLEWSESEGAKPGAVDDMLDTDAWHSLPELKHIFAPPVASGRKGESQMGRHERQLAKKLIANKHRRHGRPSWQVN